MMDLQVLMEMMVVLVLQVLQVLLVQYLLVWLLCGLVQKMQFLLDGHYVTDKIAHQI
tara:strand:- start:1023 stop:1193 length:171 start_codon:yes stop_codon:yes gene_type:complete